MSDSIPSPFRWAGIWSEGRDYATADLVWVQDLVLGAIKLPGGLFVANSETTRNGLPPSADGAVHMVADWAVRQGRTPAIFGSWTRMPEGAFHIAVGRDTGTALAWRGEWTAAATYLPGDLVRVRGDVFVARQFVQPSPSEPTASAHWEAFSTPRPLPFRGNWDATAVYKATDIVVFEHGWYAAKADGITQTKPSDPTQWQLITQFDNVDAAMWASLAISSAALLVSGAGAVKDILEIRQLNDFARTAAATARLAARDTVLNMARGILAQHGNPP